MPLPPPVARQHLHTRRVTCQGFFREDGLWDIEGRITDEKTYEHPNEWRGPLKPGDHVHDMSIRLTIDHKFTIVDVEAVTDKSPYQLCGGIAPDFKKLIGLRIGETIWEPRGCDRCGGSGYRGRAVLAELLIPDSTEVGRAILSCDDAPQLERRAKQAGLVTLVERAVACVATGETSPAEIRRVLGF